VPRLPRFVELLEDLSTRFSGLLAERVDAEIDRALAQILVYLGTDRASLIELREDDGSVRVTHSARRDDSPDIPSITGVVVARTWYVPTLLGGKVVRVNRAPDELPAVGRTEREQAERFNFKSNLAVPLSIGGRFVCALATATCREFRTWTDEDVQELRVTGQILANALCRARLETDLHAKIDELRALRDALRSENTFLRETINTEVGFEQILGRSPSLRRVVEQAAMVAETPASVLLLGETGTGKELLARAIHSRSPRRERAFIKVNCAALPASLVESELFGHEKGAFTGATSSKPGRFELAHEGTLFLDEVGELAQEVQAKLLRVLQDGEFERVGGVQTRKVDVRIVAATNRDLAKAMTEGRFREDLYYRLAAFPIHLPPLRERLEDVPMLAWEFLHRRGPELGRRIERISDDAMHALSSYDWPGNVRELGNVLERALILSKGSELQLDGVFPIAARVKSQVVELADVEREHIARVLERCGWKINGRGNAAETLGMHPNTLRARLAKLGLVRPL
jgi:formate hydrogenlyase transcriptional activator